MTITAPRNIHAIAEEEALAAAPQPHLGRQRERTNDPLREYAARPGRVEPLADSVAALILSRKGTVRIERHQAKVSIDGVERFYSAPESLVIAEYNGTGRPVTWYANSRKPDCIHLCTTAGVYLETLPLKREAKWFDPDEAGRAAHAEAVSHRNRSRRRLEELKAPEIAAAIAREEHNAEELANRVREDERIVHTFPAANAAGRRLSAADTEAITGPGRGGELSSERADTVVAAMRNADEQREAAKCVTPRAIDVTRAAERDTGTLRIAAERRRAAADTLSIL